MEKHLFSSVFNEFADTYDAEIVSLRDHLGYDNVTPENYMEVVNKNKRLAIQTVEKILLDKGFSGVRKLAEEYPYSLYDIEYQEAILIHQKH